MPYKDKEKQRKASRDSMEKKRKGLTSGVNNEMVPASYVQGITDKFKSLPERLRYLELSDGQVLDRLNQPEGHTSGDFIIRMRACNESAYNFKPNEPDKAKVKAMIKEAMR